MYSYKPLNEESENHGPDAQPSFYQRLTEACSSVRLLRTALAVLFFVSIILSILLSMNHTTISNAPHGSHAAVIIESRPLSNLIPVILHFSSVLGPQWPVVLYTTAETEEVIMRSRPFARLVETKQVSVRVLDANQSATAFASHNAVSVFLEDPWLWEDLAPYKKVLLFQPDSILCSASSARIEDFLEWDFIGAPIDPRYGTGFNGGLSLRNRELILRVLQDPSKADPSWGRMEFEDQYFHAMMEHLPTRADGSPAARLPSVEVAGQFAVETIWHDRPLGYHQPHRWHKGRISEIMEWCPEVAMLSGVPSIHG